MTIAQLNLPDEYLKKLEYIQTLTQQDRQTLLLAAIDLYYHQLTQTTDPLARLKKSKLIGSFEGDANLAEQSEAIFQSLMHEKT